MSRNEDSGSSRGPMAFPRCRWAVVGVVLGVLGSSWVGVHRGQTASPDGVVESSDQPEGTIDGAVRKVAEGVQSASSNVQGRLSRARASARNQEIETQVKARLVQDKALDADQITVQVAEEGTVILKGQVPDTDDKDLAVDLARDTRGVVRVEDHLAIPPPRRVFTPTVEEEAPEVATNRSRRTR